MSATDTLMEFFGQKVASLMRQLPGVQTVATSSRQFGANQFDTARLARRELLLGELQ